MLRGQKAKKLSSEQSIVLVFTINNNNTKDQALYNF